MKIEYSAEAFKDLSLFHNKDKIKIDRKLNYLAENYEVLKNSKNITPLVGFANRYRYKIADNLKAIFFLEKEKIIIYIIRIGFRKDVYDEYN